MSSVSESQPTVTTINRKWFLKLGVFWIVCAGLTVWGLYDGLVLYPKRGEVVVSFLTKEYLEQMESERRLRPDAVNVVDPASVFAELDGKRKRDPSSLTEEEQARFNWLEALSRVESLASLSVENEAALAGGGNLSEPTRTMFVRPRDLLASLQAELQNRTSPKRLSAWDIPSQFLIALVFGLAMLAITARVLTTVTKKYRYDPEAMALSLPGGRTVTPADIELVDKRQWSKFFVHLKMKDGGEIKLDLMRFVPLEDWILEMEKQTDGYEEEDEGSEDAAESAESETEQPA